MQGKQIVICDVAKQRERIAFACQRSAVAKFALSVALAGGISLTAEISIAQNTPDLSGVTIVAAQSSSIGPNVRMGAAGVLENVPYTIEWAEFVGSSKVIEALRGNAIDLGYGSDTAAIFSLAGGNESNFVVVMAMPMTEAHPLDGAIVVDGDSEVQTVADLRGRTLAVTPGTGSQYMATQWLGSAGLTFKDLQTANLGPADALAALNSHQIDAWATYSPFVGVATVQHGGKVITDNVRVNGSISVIFASKAALEDPLKAAAIGDFLVRLRDAHEWMSENLPAWTEAMSQEVTGVDLEVAADAAERVIRGAVPIDSDLIAKVQDQADVFYELGVLHEPVVVDNRMFDDRYNKILFPN